MSSLTFRLPMKLQELTVVGCIRRTGSSLDRVDLLSESNKKRCKAQLQALKSSLKTKKSEDSGVSKQAAVLIPMCFVDCQPSIVFTLRSNNLRNHAGQISFPGGMVSEGDTDSVATALRESEEELGLDLGNVDVWGPMLPLPYRTGDVQITPILANLGKIDVENFELNYDEVDCVFTRDILSLCSAKNFAQTTYSPPPAGGYTTPIFLGGNYKIWGLTAIILHQTLNLIAPGLYTNRLVHPRTIGKATQLHN
ncbi:mitochondrial coenzyme A diphosphatase NUDT8-like [Watersipora subatra]|uniref:mitochondrial coenzyme A diphosphatase NUDT8-like n=1 Tax=Watersipora subatra TaxID=2589382 RepID=UPI00355BBE92